MHVHHLLAVTADTPSDAMKQAEDFLDHYEGSVWDWYEIGGRWEGALDGADIMGAEGNKLRFTELVRAAVAARHAEIRDLKSCLVGPGDSDEVHDRFGLGFSTDPAARTRMRQYHQESATLFSEMMASDTPEDPRFSQAAWHMRKLGTILSDLYCFDSMFYDADYGTGLPTQLFNRVTADPAKQWLVSVDLHN